MTDSSLLALLVPGKFESDIKKVMEKKNVSQKEN